MYVCMYMYVGRYVSMYLCIYVSMYLSIYLSTYLSIYLSICRSTYLSIYLSNLEPTKNTADLTNTRTGKAGKAMASWVKHGETNGESKKYRASVESTDTSLARNLCTHGCHCSLSSLRVLSRLWRFKMVRVENKTKFKEAMSNVQS